MNSIKKIIFAFSLFICNAQAQHNDWAKSFGGVAATVVCNSVSVDNTGNVYVGGSFTDSVDFDPGSAVSLLVTNYEKDGFISKYDSSGNLIWVKQIRNPQGYEEVTSVEADSIGNVFLGVNTGPDVLIQKRDSSGSIIWTHTFHHSTSSLNLFIDCKKIAVDDSGNVYATGFFNNLISFGTNPTQVQLTSVAEKDIYVAKLNNYGDLVWVKQFGDTLENEGTSIVVGRSGNIYCIGNFSGKVDFDPGLDTSYLTSAFSFSSYPDIFILKMDTAGNLIWAKSFYQSATNYASTLTLNQNEDLLITGNYDGWSTDFDPGPSVYHIPNSAGDYLAYVCMLDSASNFKWARGFFSQNNGFMVLAKTIGTDQFGNVYTAGEFEGAIGDFDPGPAYHSLQVYGALDGYISKLNQNGDFVWAISMGSINYDELNALAISKSNDMLITGVIGDTTDFDPDSGVYSLSTIGTYDGYLWKLKQCSSPVQTLFISGCDSIVLNGQKFLNSGNYFQTIQGINQCDSTNILQLTINHSDSLFYSIQACDSFQFNATNYTSSGIYYHHFNNINGCDSVLEFNLTINKSVLIPVTEIACDSFTFNGMQLTVSGIYNDTLTSVSGCDSIIKLNLTINSIDTAVSQNGVVLEANVSGLIYQWIDCNNNFQTLTGENQQQFTAGSNGIYAVIISDAVCSDTSQCYSITTVGIPLTSEKDNFLPVPTSFENDLLIKTFKSEELIILYDLCGKRVFQKMLNPVDNISLEKLTCGQYFYIIEDKFGNILFKGKTIKLPY